MTSAPLPPLLPLCAALAAGVVLLLGFACPPGAAAAAAAAAVVQVVQPPLPWRHVDCPARCACQLKPWFSPESSGSSSASSYREAAPTVDCNALLLAQLPSPLPRDTHTLRLQSNRLPSGCLESPALRALPDLAELDLSQNRLGRVLLLEESEESAKKNLSLPSLQSLHLEENRLSRLPHGTFAFLPALQELFLSHNRLRWLAPGAFAGLDQLLRLHLDNNRLRSVDPRWFAALPRLEVLMLGGNPVESLPERGFAALGGSLRSLVLGGMGLRALSEDALAGLERLESLSFYDNQLTRVPAAALRRVPGLKFLDLNKNRLRLLETGDFRGMRHLKELGLNNMESLVSVERAALDGLPELTKLEITNNPRLSYVHPEAFAGLARLESLMLNSNALAALHAATLRSLPALREVSLHSNPLRCDCLFRWAAEEPLLSSASRLPPPPPTTTPAAAAAAVAHSTASTSGGFPVRFIQPRATLCAEPPELRARRVRDVSANEMAASCLPAIAPGPLPARVAAREGGGVALHCRALAEPPPRVYWVTPSGLRLGPIETGADVADAANKTDHRSHTAAPLPAKPALATNSSAGPYLSSSGEDHSDTSSTTPSSSSPPRPTPVDSSYPAGKYRLLAEGTLEISAVTAYEAGLYTCVAENALGADTRSVTVALRGGGTGRGGGRRKNNREWGVTTHYYDHPGRIAPVLLEVREVGEHYAVLSWQGGRGGNGALPSTRLSWQAVSDAASPSSSSSSSSSDDDQSVRPTAYTTRILAGTQSFNLTHLRAETFYRVCLHPGPLSTIGAGRSEAPPRRARRSGRSEAPQCVTIRTKVPPSQSSSSSKEDEDKNSSSDSKRLGSTCQRSKRVDEALSALGLYTTHLTCLLCAGVFFWTVSYFRRLSELPRDPETERKHLEIMRRHLVAEGLLDPEGGPDDNDDCCCCCCACCACISLCCCCDGGGGQEKKKPPPPPESEKAALLRQQEC